MSIQALVLGRQVIVFLFVHLLVDDILLGDAQGTAGALLVDLRSAAGRLNACLEAAVAPTRGSDVGTAGCQQGLGSRTKDDVPLLVLLVGALRLDGLRRREGCSPVGRHGEDEGRGTRREAWGGPAVARAWGGARSDAGRHEWIDLHRRAARQQTASTVFCSNKQRRRRQQSV